MKPDIYQQPLIEEEGADANFPYRMAERRRHFIAAMKDARPELMAEVEDLAETLGFPHPSIYRDRVLFELGKKFNFVLNRADHYLTGYTLIDDIRLAELKECERQLDILTKQLPRV